MSNREMSDIFQRRILLLAGLSFPGQIKWRWLRILVDFYWLFSIASCIVWALLLFRATYYWSHIDFLSRIVGTAAGISVFSYVSKAFVIRFRNEDVYYLMETMGSVRFDSYEGMIVEKVCLFFQVSCTLIIVTHNTHILYESVKHRSSPYWTESMYGPLNEVIRDYIFGIFCSIVCISCNCMSDILFLKLSSQISIKFKVLANKISELGEPKFQENISDEKNLQSFIEEHIEIIRLSKMFNDVFSPVIFVQLIYSFCTTCLTLFGFSQADNFVIAVYDLTPQFCSLFTEIFLYCWGGEMISSEFEKLHHSVYSSSWYNCNIKLKKALVLVETFTPHPVHIKSFVFNMNFATYETICKEAFSYCTIMYQLFNQKK